jgi:hypothetical protein
MIKCWTAGEACSCKLELRNRLSICFETKENEENVCRESRSQDLQGVYRLLASRPAFEITALPHGCPNKCKCYFLKLSNAQIHRYYTKVI